MGKSKQPEVKVKMPTRWSYSSWAQWRACRMAYYHKFVLGKKDPPNKYMQRGIEVHKSAEDFLTGKLKKLPAELAKLRRDYLTLKKLKPIVEQFWGVNDEWRPTQYDSWVVMKMDAAVEPHKYGGGTLYIQDLKTGKPGPTHEKQGSLYAAIGATIMGADRVEVGFWYADHGHIENYEYTSAMIKKLRRFWIKEGSAVLDPDQKFLPTANDGCRYCSLRSSVGGPCHAWKR